MNHQTDGARAILQPFRHRPVRQVLVAEDDPMLRSIITFALNKSGYQPTGVEDGEEAWADLSQNSYDLLITDNAMPRLSGVSLVKRLRAANSDLPVIMASGSVPEEAEALHLSGVLQKPYSIEKLLTLVQTTMESHCHSTMTGRARTWKEPAATVRR